MVCDNLNAHDRSSFYEAFPPAEVLRLARRFEFHYTPSMAAGSILQRLSCLHCQNNVSGKEGLTIWMN